MTYQSATKHASLEKMLHKARNDGASENASILSVLAWAIGKVVERFGFDIARVSVVEAFDIARAECAGERAQLRQAPAAGRA